MTSYFLMMNNQPNDFLNAFGDLFRKMAKEFGEKFQESTAGGSGVSDSFFENAAREQAKKAKTMFDQLIDDGFSENQALKVVAMMNRKEKR